jgi:hypothetical protein
LRRKEFLKKPNFPSLFTFYLKSSTVETVSGK